MCDDTGVYLLVSGDDDHGVLTFCSCETGLRRRDERVATLRKASGVPVRFSSYTFDSYLKLNLSDKQKYAARVCMAYAERGYLTDASDNLRTGLFLYGNVGCGKSGLAAAICNEVISAGIRVLYTTVPDLLDLIRSTFGTDRDASYSDTIDRVERATLLVLDDLGTESPTPWVSEKLFQIVDHRYRNGTRLIVTSNLAPHELMDHFEATKDNTGKRMVDRLIDMCALVDVSGRNLRR